MPLEADLIRVKLTGNARPVHWRGANFAGQGSKTAWRC